jgi:hypothetical protein
MFSSSPMDKLQFRDGRILSRIVLLSCKTLVWHFNVKLSVTNQSKVRYMTPCGDPCNPVDWDCKVSPKHRQALSSICVVALREQKRELAQNLIHNDQVRTTVKLLNFMSVRAWFESSHGHWTFWGLPRSFSVPTNNWQPSILKQFTVFLATSFQFRTKWHQPSGGTRIYWATYSFEN